MFGGCSHLLGKDLFWHQNKSKGRCCKSNYEMTASGIALHIKRFLWNFPCKFLTTHFNHASVIIYSFDVGHKTLKYKQAMQFPNRAVWENEENWFCICYLRHEPARKELRLLEKFWLFVLLQLASSVNRSLRFVHMHYNGHLIATSSVRHFLFIMIHLDPQAGET